MDTMDMRTGIEAEVQKRWLVAVEMGAHQQGWELKPCIWARPPEEKGERWAWPGQHLRMRRGCASITNPKSTPRRYHLWSRLNYFLQLFYSLDPYSLLEAAIAIYFYLIWKVCFTVGFSGFDPQISSKKLEQGLRDLEAPVCDLWDQSKSFEIPHVWAGEAPSCLEEERQECGNQEPSM